MSIEELLKEIQATFMLEKDEAIQSIMRQQIEAALTITNIYGAAEIYGLPFTKHPIGNGKAQWHILAKNEVTVDIIGDEITTVINEEAVAHIRSIDIQNWSETIRVAAFDIWKCSHADKVVIKVPYEHDGYSGITGFTYEPRPTHP